MLAERTQIDDKTLFLSLQSGDRKAFDTLFSRHYPPLCAYASRYVDFEDAEEIVQDIMVWFWQNRTSQQFEISLKAYLFAMVRNKCITLINRNSLRQRILDSLPEKMGQLYENPDFYVAKELSERINTALSHLPESYREVFELNRFGDMTYKEIAEHLKISPKTVDYRIQQALKLLRTELKDYLPVLIICGIL